jgi:uncharacterized protein
MIFGILQFELLIPGAGSLKDKRRVVKSVKDRLHREHLVAVAEVGEQETLNVAVLGVAAIGSEGERVGRTLDAVLAKLRTVREGELGATTRRIGSLDAMEPSPGLDAEDVERLRGEMLGLMGAEGDER